MAWSEDSYEVVSTLTAMRETRALVPHPRRGGASRVT
jgi:hypothetical protein